MSDNEKMPSAKLLLESVVHFARIIVIISHWIMPFAFIAVAVIKHINDDTLSSIYYLCFAILAYLSYEDTCDWFEKERVEFSKSVDKEIK